jgi:hypothetical protein
MGDHQRLATAQDGVLAGSIFRSRGLGSTGLANQPAGRGRNPSIEIAMASQKLTSAIVHQGGEVDAGQRLYHYTIIAQFGGPNDLAVTMNVAAQSHSSALDRAKQAAALFIDADPADFKRS